MLKEMKLNKVNFDVKISRFFLKNIYHNIFILDIHGGDRGIKWPPGKYLGNPLKLLEKIRVGLKI